jgi:hypothetical protein
VICACGECYACGLRAKGLQLSPRLRPSGFVCRPMRQPSWEGGPVLQERPGGHRVPVLAPGTTRPMTQKERADLGRSKVEEGLRRLRQDPHVYAQEG